MAEKTNSIDTIVQDDKSQYAISPGKNGTLDGYTSNDDLNPTSFDDIDPMSASDNNSTTFSNLTTMVKNHRLLNGKIGDTEFSDSDETISDKVASLKSELNNKSALNHKHAVSTLPVTSNLVNSSDLVPTSALVNSIYTDVWGQLETMNATLKDIDDKTKDYNTNGYSTDDLGTWSSKDDVDQFLKKYNHSTGYSDGVVTLKLGNTITINDGKFNAKWMIAGFDVESKTNVVNGVDCNNGYGIALIPYKTLGTYYWGYNHYIVKTGGTEKTFWNWTWGGYARSDIHIYLDGCSSATEAILRSYDTSDRTSSSDKNRRFTNMLSTAGTVKKALQSILGDHLIERKVALSGSVRGSYADEVKTAYVTLMSYTQMTGNSEHSSVYDHGEANYKLPVFNYTSHMLDGTAGASFDTSNWYWFRAINDGTQAYLIFQKDNPYDDDGGYWYTYGYNLDIVSKNAYDNENVPAPRNYAGVRPMIYVR